MRSEEGAPLAQSTVTFGLHSRLRVLACVVVAAGMYRVAFPPLALWPLAWVCLVPLLIAVRGVPVSRALLAGYGFGFAWVCLHGYAAYWGTTTYFARPWYVGVLAGAVVAPGYFGIWSGLAVAAYLGLHRGLGWHPVAAVVTGWLLGDVAHTRLGVFAGNLLAASQAPTPTLLQLAEWGGAPIAAVPLVAVNALLAEAFVRRRGAWRRPVALALAVVVATAMYGAVRITQVERALERPDARTLRVGLVQPDFRRAVVPTDSDARIARLRRLTREAYARGAEVVLWPEGTGGQWPDQPHWHRLLRGDERLIAGVSAELRIPIGREMHELVYQSAAAWVDAESQDAPLLYAKRRMFPFSEAPVLGIERLILGLRAENDRPLTPGTNPPPVFAAPAWRTTALICFEVLFADTVRASGSTNADWLAVISNDEWFDASSEGAQHHAQVAVAAIATRRPVARAVNTGVSGAFDPAGRALPLELYLWPEEERSLRGHRYTLPISLKDLEAAGRSPLEAPIRRASIPKQRAGMALVDLAWAPELARHGRDLGEWLFAPLCALGLLTRRRAAER